MAVPAGSFLDKETMMENAMISNAVLLLELILVFGLTQIAIYFRKRYLGKEIEGRNWAGLFGMCAGCFAATAIVATNMVSLRMFSVGQVIVLVILVALNFLSYFFIQSLQKKTGQSQKQACMRSRSVCIRSGMKASGLIAKSCRSSAMT